MADENVFAKLGLMVAGATGAIALDQTMPQYAQNIGGVRVEPGAMLGAALTVGLALMPKGAGNGAGKSIRSGVASLAGGMLVYEGSKLAEAYVLPYIPGLGAPPTTAPPGALPAGAPGGAAGNDFSYYDSPAFGAYGGDVSDWELQRSMMQFR